MNKKKITAVKIIVLVLTGIGSGAAMAAIPAVPAPNTAVTDTATPVTPAAPNSESAVAKPPRSNSQGGHGRRLRANDHRHSVSRPPQKLNSNYRHNYR